MMVMEMFISARHGRPRGGHPSGACPRAEETPSLADARAMDGRVRPGHDERVVFE